MSDSSATKSSALLRTPLYDLHRELGAKLVPFAGYEMPLQYAAGIVKEHSHVRAGAGIFDVSHMGQARLEAEDFETAAMALESLVPGDILGLKPGQMRYTQLLNEAGGIIDDLMATRMIDGRGLLLVVNASRKSVDFTHIETALPPRVRLIPEPDRALLALQGPKAADVLARIMPGAERLGFLRSDQIVYAVGLIASVSRSGYTGEDGFEISVPENGAADLARTLLGFPEVLPIGLGARDTLRLEAGLCLYGQDMDEATSPVEAALEFSIGKRRREQGGFPGAGRVLKELSERPRHVRVGLTLEGRAAARSGMEIADTDGKIIGKVTSGAFTPTASASIAMGYVQREFASAATTVTVLVRGTPVMARVTPMPFVAHRYFRKS